MEAGILVGYFTKRDEARGALRELQRRGFRRAALVSKAADGEVRTWDPFLWRRAFDVTLAFILFGVLAEVAFIGLHWREPILGRDFPALIPILVGGFIGTLFAGVSIRRSKYGVERRLLEDHKRWLASEETVLILQTPIETLRFPVAVLRESGEIPPAVFVLHPKRESLTGDVRSSGVPLSPAQIQEHAQRLATDHQVDPDPQRNTGLLERLEQARQWIHQACLDLSEESRLGQSVPPTAEWLLDNEYIITSNARDVQLNLPRRYYHELPALANKPYRGLPRIYGLARELVSHMDLRLDKENILAFIEAYQSVRALSIGELWAVPQMLRTALIESIQHLAERALTELREREIADFWANRLITANRRDPNQLFSILAELVENQRSPSPYFASLLIHHLYDEGAALVPVQSWLERTFRKSLNDLNLREQNRQTKDQLSIGNAFTSLRQLALLDWRQLFEHLSRVEQLLRLDPSGVYPKMDFATRDRYRRAVEEFARGSGQAEEEVAQRAIEMAARTGHESAEDARWVHVGTYLIGEGRPELARLIRCRETPRFRVLQWVYRHHSAVYFLGLSFFFAVFISLIVGFGLGGRSAAAQVLISLLLLIPISQLALQVVNYLVTRLLPPRPLSKMDFEDAGIPDAFRTLVVVPVLLGGEEAIRGELEKLEIRYLANKEANLLFSLFTDYADSDQMHCEGDERLLQTAIEGLESLQHRYGGERFFLFHRNRTWSESEQKYIGWERKRGKLEELNRLIDGTRPENAGRLVFLGDPDHLSNVRFVITLDSDTQLPHGTARRLIETLAHPLNQPRFDAEGRIVAGSYTIIQPRVSPTLPSTSASPFTRLFADAVGIDPYTNAISDVNQDLSGEGSYHGKGIYDVRAFSRVLSGRLPAEWVLSHDLIEGAYVRVGLASDIELYDEFPPSYRSYSSRRHRWIRGDWQIADWILPRVPQPGGHRGPNPLSWFDRWKIFDNLRRSLLPATSLGLLIASWLASPRLGWISSLMVAIQLLFHPFAQSFTMATTPKGLKGFSLSRVAHDVLRALADATLLPHQAGLATDAILRVGYRRLISHHKLLEWTPARVGILRRQTWFVPSWGLESIFSVLVGWAVYRWMPSSLAMAGPWLMLWLLSPLLRWLLNLRPPATQKQFLLSEQDRRFVRDVARRTWRFFSDFVGEKTSWLPPDNYQVSPLNQLAMRTSPTNIGLWILSALAAHDFGYLTGDEVIEKLTNSMETIGKLERYEGHLLNWYNLQTLTPLEPRYVSAVDSGNLLGALWTLEQGLDELMQAPVLDVNAFAGLRDTAEILRQVVEQEGISGLDAHRLVKLMPTWEAAPAHRIADALRLLRQVEDSVRALADEAHGSAGLDVASVYWTKQMEKQVSAWLGTADRYLAWIKILDEKTEEEVALLGQEAVLAFRQDLRDEIGRAHV